MFWGYVLENAKGQLYIGDRTPQLRENWLRGLDLNQRPSGYEPDELPGCSTPRDENSWDINSLQIEKPFHQDQTHLSFGASRLR